MPLGEDEVRHYAKDLRPVLYENWAMVAEHKDTGEVVGATLTLPDLNQVLGEAQRAATALRLVHGAARKTDRRGPRVFALGVKPAYQHTGVAARFYQMHFDAAERTHRRAARWAGPSRDQPAGLSDKRWICLV